MTMKFILINGRNGEEDGLTSIGAISKTIRRYLFEKNNNACELCGWSVVHPKTGTVPLQIHHIDGDCRNNKEENLQLLCPNCHTLTENWGRLNDKSNRLYVESDRRNLNKEKVYKKVTNFERLRKVKNRPSKEDLFEMIKTMPFTKIGKMYNVCGTTIVKWCESYGLPHRKEDIKKLL